MDENKTQIDFVESCRAYGPSGGVRTASYYNFEVDGKQVAVEVPDSAVSTRDGKMPQEKVKLAAKSFLESEIERRGLANLPNGMILQPPTMDSVLNRFGWAPRFDQS
jgi:hypothetical protein